VSVPLAIPVLLAGASGRGWAGAGFSSRKGATTPGVVAGRYVHRDDLPGVDGKVKIEEFLNLPAVAPSWVERESSECRP